MWEARQGTLAGAQQGDPKPGLNIITNLRLKQGKLCHGRFDTSGEVRIGDTKFIVLYSGARKSWPCVFIRGIEFTQVNLV